MGAGKITAKGTPKTQITSQLLNLTATIVTERQETDIQKVAEKEWSFCLALSVSAERLWKKRNRPGWDAQVQVGVFHARPAVD